MRTNKIFAFVLVLLLSICFFGCHSTQEYTSDNKDISLLLDKNYNIEENENYILAESKKDKIKIIITSTDIYDDIDSEYKELLKTSQLDIQSGAFDANYNNYVYVGNLFAYLLDGNADGITPTWVDKTTIGKENYLAYYSALSGKDKCGYIYETLQNAKLYIICIYIDDTYAFISN